MSCDSPELNSQHHDPRLGLCDVVVFGGGISGITTGLVLQSLGLTVGILASEFPVQVKAEAITPELATCWRCPRSSRVATTYAMASAYPHNLRVNNLHRVSDDSQAVFALLLEKQAAGVHLYRMYEVFEHCPEEAPLRSRRMKFQEFDGRPADLKQTIDPPHRPGAPYLWGWTFETYFADMPKYMPFLWKLFAERGGIWQMSDESLESILEVAEGRPVINCLGVSAVKMFGDPAPAVIVRGRQVVVPKAPLVKAADGLPLAYNYTPPAELFLRADGSAEYVHFFPRQDGWILGQTREPGQLDEYGRWRGDAVRSLELSIDDQPIPSPVVELNREILRQWINRDWSGLPLIGREGYRYYRDPQGQGVRLESEEIEGTLFIHNYGHGGSGITMSWGCSIEVARIFLKQVGAKRQLRRGQAGQELDRLISSLVAENER